MRARWCAGVVLLALVAAACGSSGSGAVERLAGRVGTKGLGGGRARTVDQPGVTKDTIRIGGVVSKTNPINGPYASAFDGTKAYFNMVNSKGGLFGRKLKLVAERDDQVSNNLQEVQGLLQQDDVFAVLPIATIFSFGGAKSLAQQGVPAFGWGINDEWVGPTNLFQVGGTNCVECYNPLVAEVAKSLHKKKVGILAYNVPNSKVCSEADAEAFRRYRTAKVEFITNSLSFGVADFSVEVKKMKEKGVDFVLTCMDQNAILNLAKEMRKQGLHAAQYLQNGYDQPFIKANKEFFRGAIVRAPFTPFEFRPQPKGLRDFNKWMDKARYTKNELAMYGWMSADLFVTGMRAAGPDFTRKKLIDTLNGPKLKDYAIQGLQPGSLTVNHVKHEDLACTALVKVDKNGKFVPTFFKPGKPFMCVPQLAATFPASPTFR